ncbi:hypothetical protein M3Y96_00946800 [Aphelenchoides besseyi]|nr:hypothetical protein M3Y96_00946800 [Aphelenchoides besseyi]
MQAANIEECTRNRFPLPVELHIKILRYLDAETIDAVQNVNDDFRTLVKHNRMHLARHDCRLEFKNMKVGISGDKTKQKQFKLESEADQLLSLLKQLQTNCIKICGPITETELDQLISVLNLSRQFRISSFILQSVTIENTLLCSRLWETLVAGNCQAIKLEDCRLSCGFTERQFKQLQDLCQFTVKNCKSGNGLGILGRYLSKLAFDMRFKPRRSVPFYAEAPNLKPGELCEFIKTWIHISEAPAFQIYVNNCDADFMHKFRCECEQNQLSQFDFEFKSKSHPWAYIKASFDERIHRFQMHPVFDVPTSRDRSICRVRHFRDF